MMQKKESNYEPKWTFFIGSEDSKLRIIGGGLKRQMLWL